MSPHGCSQCRRTFPNPDALHAHCVDSRSKNHHYCPECSRLFFGADYLAKHLESTVHVKGGGPPPVTCNLCNKDFYTWGELNRHCKMRKNDHFHCTQKCGIIFPNAILLQEHMKDTGHRHPSFHNSQFNGYDTLSCRICSILFKTRKAMDDHLGSVHNWCFDCARGFDAPGDRTQHQRSIAHKPRNIRCAMCPQMFKEPSSISHHLESGECPTGITRHHIFQAVQALKVKPSILIGEDESQQSSSTTLSDVTEIFSSATSASSVTAISIGTVTAEVATEETFNGTSYECPRCEKKFRALSHLNLHLRSAAHDEEKFKCPDCDTQFTLLSGLIQHLESESCGAASIGKVEKEANLLVAQFAKLLCGA